MHLRILFATVAVACYSVAWVWTWQAAHALFMTTAVIELFDTLLCPAQPPNEIMVFLGIMFAIFTSFAVWYFWIWATEVTSCARSATRSVHRAWLRLWRVAASDTEGPEPGPIAGGSAEIGYIVLSAVAKTVLHGLLAVTSLGRTYSEKHRNRLVESELGALYEKGFPVAGGIFAGVIVLFLVVWRVCRATFTAATEPGPVKPYYLFSVIALRWVDYAVSAPLMWVVLSVSWGLSSYPRVCAGAALHAVAMLCAAGGEDQDEDRRVVQQGRLWKVMHGLAGVVHIASAITIAVIADYNGVLTTAVPYTETGDPMMWFEQRALGDNCDLDPSPESLAAYPTPVFVQADTEPLHERSLYLGWAAVTFALWSGIVHVVTILTSSSKTLQTTKTKF